MKKVLMLISILILLFVVNVTMYAQIVISEIMQNPDTVGDAQGEWFEIYNAGPIDIDINGWTIRDAGSDSHVIDNGSLNITAGGFLVLGRNGDTGLNGNYTADYVYTSFTLGNSDDEIVLVNGSGIVIDSVAWDGGPIWPDPTGSSMVYIGTPLGNNNDGSNWATATTREQSYVGVTGDNGSPGTNGNDQSLPVELASFTAVGGDAQVSLKWVTQSEIDNQGFVLERSQDKSGNYHQIASYENDQDLRGAGNSSSQQVYTYVDKGLLINGQTYWYKLIDVDVNGVRTEHPAISAVPHISSADLDVIDNSNLPKNFALNGNFPNPFNPKTTISFDIPETENNLINVNLSVYNMLGQKITTLLNEPLAANSYEVKWLGIDAAGKLVPSGIYFYILKTTDFISSHKMMLIK